MTDLTDRMRTCAAHLKACRESGDPWSIEPAAMDAAALLIEAADLLEATSADLHPIALGEPMAVIETVVGTTPAEISLWLAPGDPLPGLKRSGTVSPRACPKCDSRATKTVRRIEGRMMLECPTCDAQWEMSR